MQAALSGESAFELMSGAVVSIPEHTPAAHAGTDHLQPYRYASFPVVDEQGRAVRLVSIKQIETLPPEHRAERSVGEIADRAPT